MIRDVVLDNSSFLSHFTFGKSESPAVRPTILHGKGEVGFESPRQAIMHINTGNVLPKNQGQLLLIAVLEKDLAAYTSRRHLDAQGCWHRYLSSRRLEHGRRDEFGSSGSRKARGSYQELSVSIILKCSLRVRRYVELTWGPIENTLMFSGPLRRHMGASERHWRM